MAGNGKELEITPGCAINANNQANMQGSVHQADKSLVLTRKEQIRHYLLTVSPVITYKGMWVMNRYRS